MTISMPLVVFQESILHAQQLLGDNFDGFLLPLVFEFKGAPLSTSTILSVINHLVSHHEVLRSSYSLDDSGSWKATVISANKSSLITTLQIICEASDQETAEKIIGEFFHRWSAIELLRGPIIRFGLVHISGANPTSLLLLLVHHAAFDASSAAVLIQDIHDFFHNKPASSSSPYFSFQIPSLDHQESNWKATLQGVNPEVSFPREIKTEATGEYSADRLQIHLPQLLAAKLHRFCTKTSSSRFCLLMAAFQILLYRFNSSEHDFTVGTPINCRFVNKEKWNNTVGCLVDTVPIATYIKNTDTFNDLIASCQESLKTIRNNPELVTSRILDISSPSGIQPGFRTVVQWLDFTRFDIMLSDTIKLSAYNRYDMLNTIMFDMVTNFWFKENENVVVEILYRSQLFSQEMVASLFDTFIMLLNGLLATPSLPVSSIPLLSPSQDKLYKDTLVGSFDECAFHSVIDVFDAMVLRYPNAIAISDSHGTSWTYLELQSLSSALQKKIEGEIKEVRDPLCAVLIDRSPLLILALVSILRAGAGFVIVDPTLPVTRQEYIVGSTACQAILTVDKHALSTTLFALAPLILVDAATLCREQMSSISHSPSETGINYVAFTSGSSGLPKPAAISHRAVLLRFCSTNRWAKIGPGDVQSCIANISFDGFVLECYTALLNGASLHMLSNDEIASPELFAQVCQSHGITHSFFPTALFHTFAAVQPNCFANLKLIFVGGEALQKEAIESLVHALGKLPEHGLMNLYGPTEIAVTCCAHTIHDIDKDCRQYRTIPIGQSLPNVIMSVIDSDGAPVPPGVTGELLVGGPSVAGCYYLGLPKITEENWIEKSCGKMYRTGDLVQLSLTGGLLYQGRMDKQIKVRGFRVELGEIENTIASFPGVAQVVVSFRASQLIGFIVPHSNLKLDDIYLYLKTRLPQQCIPNNLIIIENIPLTQNGKVDYNALPWPQQNNSVSAKHDSSVEQILAEIECGVLGITAVSADANFFALGGDSIMAIVVATKAKKAGIPIGAADVIRYPTLKLLAQSVKVCFTPSCESKEEQQLYPMTTVPTPTQEWCFALKWSKINCFTQALFFKLPNVISITQAQQAFFAVLAAHQGLCVTYSAALDTFQIDTTTSAHEITTLTVTDPQSIVEHAKVLASKLDIERGPLILASLITVPHDQQVMLFCANHLVIDVVSWYVLKNDFLESLEGISLLPKPSWLALSEQLASDSIIEYFIRSEKSYWENIDSTKWAAACVLPLQCKSLNPINQTIERSNIITQSCQVYLEDNSQIVAIMLAALGLALCGNDIFHRGLLVCMENNGRQSKCPSITQDFSEAVGWFTTLYPLLIGGCGAGDTEQLIASITKKMASIPNNGFGYGVLRYNTVGDVHKKLVSLADPQISFNFFGKASDVFSTNFTPNLVNQDNYQDTLFIPSCPVGQKPFLIEVICTQKEKYMQLSMNYSSDMFEHDVIKEIMINFSKNLDVISKTRNQANAYQVTPMQEGMVFHSQSDPESLVYKCQAIYSVISDDPLDVEKLKQAWLATIAAHSVVTNTFYWKSGILWQKPQSDFELPWKVVHSPDDFYKSCQQSRATLDILKGKTFEVIVDTAAKQMAITFHHAILDGWSLALLIKYLVNEYCHGSTDVPAQMPQFREYLLWFQEQQIALQADAEKFWKTQLQDVQPTLIVPLLSPQPHESKMSLLTGRLTERQTFSTHLLEAVTTLAKALCVSPFVIYHTAWLSVISRFMGTSDLVIGITVSGRMYSDFLDIESLAGLLINTIPHRIIMDQSESIVSIIQRIQSQLHELFAHSHVSLPLLNSWCGLTQRDQLFDSIIVFENYPMPKQEAKFSLCLKQINEQTNFPLSLCVDASGASLHYNGEKIGAYSARLILRCFLQSLEQSTCSRNNSLCVADITLITEDERDLLVCLNEDQMPKLQYHTLCSLVEEKAVLSPHSVAILDHGESYTYKQMIDQAKGIACVLASEFSKPCSRFVAIGIKRSYWLISSMLGVHMAGGAYVLVDESLPSERIATMISDIQCAAFLSLSDSVLPVLQTLGCPLMLVDTITASITATSPLLPLDISHVIYTSGSTGKPKGVIITHKNMVSRLASKTKDLEPAWLNVGSGDIVANLCSPSFDVYFSEVFHALIHGAAIAIIPERTVRSPRDTALAFSEMGVTHVFMPTALFHALAATCPEVFIPLKHIHVGGEALQLPLLNKVISVCGNRLPPLGFVNGYGPTEATIGSHRYIIRDVEQVKALSSIPIGQPCPQTLQYIVDATGKLAPIGMVGELLLGGDCVSPGYLNKTELTAQKFTHNYFSLQQGKLLYHTGDLVRWTETGDIEFFGRKDRQVKVRGYRIELEEVEAALLSCNGVVSAAVIVSNNNALTAFVVPYSEIELTYTELVAQLQKLLPQYMIPTKFAVLASIPTTTGGKVDKIALLNDSHANVLISKSIAGIDDITTKSPLLVSLSEIWSKVLGTHIQSNANFFELGGDSILAMRAARFAEEQGIDVSVHDIFDHPILRDLAGIVLAKDKNIATSLQKPDIIQPCSRIYQDQIAPGIVSLAVAVPDKKFREDKLSELIALLNLCTFPVEYIEHISNTGKCPGTLLSNEWYMNQPWFSLWFNTVAKVKVDPFDGLETRTRFPFDPDSLRETCQPFRMLSSDAATLAGAAAMVYAGISPLDIDGFIDCAIPQDDSTDLNYLKVHKKLGLKNATPLSMFTACTSFISATEAATAYVKAGYRKCILVCATQVGSHISDPTSPVGYKLADGAVAAIISPVQIGRGYQGSHGSGLGEYCSAMDLSLKHPYLHRESPRAVNLCHYLHPGDMSLYDQLFGVSVKEMVSVCQRALQLSGITDPAKVLLAPHQPNSELPMLWARELGIKRVHFSWKKYGSMGPACPAVNLFQAIEQGELTAGEMALLAAPGISMNYYALVECITNELVQAITGKIL